MLWEIAYAELVFVDVLWPEFRREHLYKCLEEYAARERRFGLTSAQLASDVDRRDAATVSCSPLGARQPRSAVPGRGRRGPDPAAAPPLPPARADVGGDLRRVADRDARVLRDDAAGRGSPARARDGRRSRAPRSTGSTSLTLVATRRRRRAASSGCAFGGGTTIALHARGGRAGPLLPVPVPRHPERRRAATPRRSTGIVYAGLPDDVPRDAQADRSGPAAATPS